MAVTVQQEVAALYSAIFNRAPDQAGLQFWTDAINGGDTLVQAAEGFTQHPVFAETYAGLTDAQFVEQLYLNVLGGAGDAEGIQFWTDKLASGVSQGQVVAEFVQGALTIDLDALLASGELSQADYDAAVVRQDSLTNKATVGVHFADKFGAASNLSADTDTTTKAGLEADPVYMASQAAIANVTADPASVTAATAAIDAADAPADLGGAVTSGLTEALATLSAAQEAVAVNLEEAAENELVEAATGATTREKIADAYSTATNELASEIQEADADNSNFATVSTAVREAMIAEAQQTVDSNVTDAREAVAEVEGLEKAINSVVTAQSALETAEENQEGTQANAAGAVAKFNALPTTSVTVTYSPSTAAGTAVVLDGSTPVISSTPEGALVIAEGYRDDAGITDLYNAVQADVNALKAIESAQANLSAASQAVVELENPDGNAAVDAFQALVSAYDTALANYDVADTGTAAALEAAWADLSGGFTLTSAPVVTDADSSSTVTAAEIVADNAGIQLGVTAEESALASAVPAPLASALLEALQNQEDFAEALTNYRATSELVEAVDSLDGDVEAAVEAIEALDYVVDDNNVGSADNDVFIFDNEDATVTGFGVEGDDILYIGAGFNQVDVAAGVDVQATKQGDASVLEVFFQQVGTSAVIHIESETYAGNAITGFEGSTITLTGVNVADLQLSEEGFITVA